MSTLKIKRENGKIFCPLADSWHIETPEEKVRQEYIKILVEDYGYSLDQMAQEIKVNNSQRGQGKARADIVIWKSKQDKIESKAAFIVVECKAENVRIREEDYYQGLFYQPKKEFLRLLLDVCKVPVQHPSGQQVIIQHPVVLPQKGAPPLAVNADRPFFFGR